MKIIKRGSKPLRPVAATRSSKLHPLIIKFLALADLEKEAYLADLAAKGKHTHVARYRKYWAADQAGKLTRHDRDFADQKSRKGEFFIGVFHEIAAALQDRFAELGLTFKSGNRGEQFLREKEGSGKWSVAEVLDYQDHLDSVEASRRHFFYDEVCSDGALRTKKKKLQVSKESAGKREPTPLSKVEVQFPPMVMRQLAFLRDDMLSEGRSEADFEKAAVGLVEEILPILVDHLEERTGQRVVGAFAHFDSGFFHLGFWLTRVGENLRQIGVAQLGLTGRVNIGWHSQVTAGYKLPPGAAEKYTRHMALMRDRYNPDSEQAKGALGRGAKFDGLAVDLGLSDRLMKFFREEAAPVVGYWERGCAVYREYLEATEPQKAAKRGEKKMLREQVTRALLAEGEKVDLKARELSLETQRRQVQAALEKGLAASGLADDKLRSGVREVTGEFALNRLAEAVVSGQLDVIALWEAAKAGVEVLLEWLRNLFKVSVPEVTKPVFTVVEAAAPETPVVAEEAPATEQDIAWLVKWDRWLGWFDDLSAAPIGPDLEALFANVRRGVAMRSGLTAEQVGLGFEQEAELQAWVEAELKAQKVALAARPAAPPAPSTPGPDKAQDSEVLRAPVGRVDETPGPVFDPQDQLSQACLAKVKSWRRGNGWDDLTLQGRAGSIEELEQFVAGWMAQGRFGLVKAVALVQTPKVRRTEEKVQELLEKAPFLNFKRICAQLANEGTVDQAIAFVTGEKAPPK